MNIENIGLTVIKFISALGLGLGSFMMLTAHLAPNGEKLKILGFYLGLVLVLYVFAVESSASFDDLRKIFSSFLMFLIYAMGSFIFVKKKA